MTTDAPRLDFDEVALQERLGTLNFERQMTFVASCAERAAPTCIAYFESNRIDADANLIWEVVATSWRAALDPEERLKDRSVADELWRQASIDGEWHQPITSYVPDCASAIYFAADFQISGSLKSASESARWLYNALDALAVNRRGIRSGTAADFEAITGDRVIQRELMKQERDLRALEGASTADTALVERIRADSARLGRAMLEEFEAESARRLHRGPPPRVFPDPERPE